MRESLPEYFEPSRSASDFIKTATIVLDTNVIRALYRYSHDTRAEAVRALSGVADRLWFPHQVSREYLRDRDYAVGGLDKAYDKAVKAVNESQRLILREFQSGRPYQRSREAVEEVVTVALDNLVDQLRELRDQDESRVTYDDDPIFELILELSAGRTGAGPDPATKRRRLGDFFEYRQKYLIPPGYSDAGKRGAAAAGDYLIWCEILDRARETDEPILFVTDDTKEDWYEKGDGGVGGPRRELVREFAHHSTAGYHQVTFIRLIELANEHLELDVPDEAVEEIRRDEEVGSSLRTLAPTIRQIAEDYSALMSSEAGRRLTSGAGFDAIQQILARDGGLAALRQMSDNTRGLDAARATLASASGLSALQQAAASAGGLSALQQAAASAGGLSALQQALASASGVDAHWDDGDAIETSGD